METVRRWPQSTWKFSGDVMMEHDLRQHMVAIAQRDETAFSELYDATVNNAWALAMHITRQKRAAEAVVEDCYWQVWCDAHRFDAEGRRVLTWLLSICRSRALDYLRREAALMPEIEFERAAEQSCADEGVDILQWIRPSSEVYRALLTLKPMDRQLISLAFFRGLTHGEIGNECAIPQDRVKSSLRNALRQLHETLGGEGWVSDE